MNRLTMSAIGVAMVSACVLPSPSAAQVPLPPSQVGAYSQPGYSPYLNLLRPGNAAVNYYGLVRPQIGYTNSIQGLQYQVNSVGTQVTESQLASMPLMTGHTTGFMRFSHFYGGAGGRAGVGIARPVGTAANTPITTNPSMATQASPAVQGGRFTPALAPR